MQRILSILLTLVLGLAPTIAAVPASAFESGWRSSGNESSLPACCRKNGVHHCTHNHQAAGTETSISAANCCPCWPGQLASSAIEIAAVVAATSRSIEDPAEQAIQPHSTISLQFGPTRGWPKRGPPSPWNLQRPSA